MLWILKNFPPAPVKYSFGIDEYIHPPFIPLKNYNTDYMFLSWKYRESHKNVELWNCGIVELGKRFIKRYFHSSYGAATRHEGLSWKYREE